MNVFYETFKKYNNKPEKQNKQENDENTQSENKNDGFISKFEMSKYFKPTEKADPIFYNINTTLTEIYNKESRFIKIPVNRIYDGSDDYYCEILEFTIPLYKKREIRYDNMGHEAKHKLQGDIIIVIKVSEDNVLDIKKS